MIFFEIYCGPQPHLALYAREEVVLPYGVEVVQGGAVVAEHQQRTGRTPWEEGIKQEGMEG